MTWIVEGPFRYVTAAETESDACGMPVAYPPLGPGYRTRYAERGTAGDRVLYLQPSTYTVEGVQYATIYYWEAGGVTGLGGARYSESELPLVFSGQEPSTDTCFRHYYGSPAVPQGDRLSVRGPNAFSVLHYEGVLMVRGAGAPPTALVGREETPLDEPMARMVPPDQRIVYTLSGGMTLADVIRLEAERVRVELAPGVSHIPGTPGLELELVEDWTIPYLQVKLNGAGITSHPNWISAVDEYLNGRRIPGAVYFAARVSRGNLRIDMGVVQAAIPLGGLDARVVVPPVVREGPDVNVVDNRDPGSSLYSWTIGLPAGSRRVRIKARGGALLLSTFEHAQFERLAVTLDFSSSAHELSLDMAGGGLTGSRFRPDFGGLDIHLDVGGPDDPSPRSYNQMLAFVRA